MRTAEKKAYIRLLCLLLSLFLVLPLAACGGASETSSESNSASESVSESASESESETDADKWAGVDFGGEELRYNISIAKSTTSTYDAADKYIRDPDLAGADEVLKKVYDRNATVRETLGITVVFDETDAIVSEVLGVLEKLFLLTEDDAPDIFNNDVYDIVHASYRGMLWNLTDPGKDAAGNDVVSYFDFDHPSWHKEYMLGTSVYPEKVYVAAGDCFMDVMRMAWVIVINQDLLLESFSYWFESIGDFYTFVQEKEWTYGMLGQMAEEVHRDTANEGVTDKDDAVIGFAAGGCMERIFTWTTGFSVLEEVDGALYVKENNADFFAYAEAFRTLYNTTGVMRTPTSFEAVELFMTGKPLFAMSHLGEMESEEIRNLPFEKGVAPYPLMEGVAEYNTQVHDQAEVACILGNAGNFEMASAYLQLLCEKSEPVLTEYYERSLKLKYNDDPATRAIIDLIHGAVDTPFESLIVREICSGAFYGERGTEFFDMILKSARDQENSFQSTYTANFDRWEKNLEALLDIFNELE